MRLHRFYIKGKGLAKKGPSERVSLDSLDDETFKPLIHQWRDVFRYMVGSQVIMFDDSKTESLAIIESMTSTRAELVILEVLKKAERAPRKASAKAKASGPAEQVGKGKFEAKAGKERKAGNKKKPVLEAAGSDIANMRYGKTKKAAKSAEEAESVDADDGGNSSNNELWLFASIIKGDNFDLVVQKTTELGVDHIIPVISDRTIKKNVNLERLQRIAIEASEQSGRVSIPKIHQPVKLKQAISDFMQEEKGGKLLLCHQDGSDFGKVKPNLKGKIGILIGPEGGWSDVEMKLFDDRKIQKIRIGENVLRAETAAISAAALMKAI